MLNEKERSQYVERISAAAADLRVAAKLLDRSAAAIKMGFGDEFVNSITSAYPLVMSVADSVHGSIMAIQSNAGKQPSISR